MVPGIWLLPVDGLNVAEDSDAPVDAEVDALPLTSGILWVVRLSSAMAHDDHRDLPASTHVRAASTTRRRGALRVRVRFMPTSSFEPGTRLVDLRRPRRRSLIWMAVGFLGALAGQGAAWFFFHRAETFSGSFLFTIAAIGGFIFPIFQRNQKEIWDGKTSPATANLNLAIDLTMLFCGLALAWFLVPLVVGVNVYLDVFTGVKAQLGDAHGGLSRLRFEAFWPTAFANLRVLMVFFLIGVFFRYLGVLFAMVYNASHWGVILAAAFAGTNLTGYHQWFTTGSAMALVLCPHLVLEMLAYVIGAMAGVFTSRALIRYRLGSRPLYLVGRWVALLLLIAVVCILLAALSESVLTDGIYLILRDTSVGPTGY